ncbi:MAG: glycosyltransferase family 4 protein [Anaerolineales bacterium]|nr:glycosyltransferase family 4 protein [Anaerolineales bacterium]
MHIMFITGEYPPMPGGVGAYTQELAKALIASNLQVSVLTSERAASQGAAATLSQIRVMPSIRRWDWSAWGVIANLARTLDVDWLHVQYQTAAYAMHPAINFAPWWWRRQGLQVAWTYHDLRVPYLFPKAGHAARTWVTTRAAHDANLVIVTNEADRRALAGQEEYAVRIPIGSNIQGVTLSTAERLARRRLRGYSESELVVAYFGFLNRSKGGLMLIRTLQRLAQARPNVHLLMIGEQVGASDATNYAYLQEVKQLIHTCHLDQRVQWTGHQEDAEVAADLNACDVLLMPYTDGASLRRGTLMAGLANGCAIVTTTPEEPLPELVDARDLLYITPEDDAAAAGAVLRIAQDPQLAEQLRSNARTKSLEFSWQSIATQHVAEYTAATW